MKTKNKIIRQVSISLLVFLLSSSLNTLAVVASTTEDPNTVSQSSGQTQEQKTEQSLPSQKVLPSDSSVFVPEVSQTPESESKATMTTQKDENTKTEAITQDKSALSTPYSVKGTITYLDEHGKTLIPAKDVSSQVGGKFNLTAPENIADYTLDLTQSQIIINSDLGQQSFNLNEMMSETHKTTLEESIDYLNQQTIAPIAKSVELRYIYTKNPVTIGQVTVKYVDTDGHHIATDKVLSGSIGTPYQTDQLAIDGFSFKSIDGQATDQYTAEAQVVTYVYTKNSNQPVTPTPDNQTPQGSNVKQLPSTGDNQASSFVAFIMGLITLVVIMSFIGLRFKHKRSSK